MTYCAKEKRLGCSKITNGLVYGVLSMCLTNSKEIKTFVMDKFQKPTWDKELRRKKNIIVKCLIPLIIINKKRK